MMYVRRRTRLATALVAAGAAATLAFTLYAGGSPNASAASARSSSATPTVIGSVIQSLQNPWDANNVKFQKAVAAALGINLKVVPDQLTDESNEAATQNLIAAGVKGLVIDPFSQASGLADAHYAEQDKVPFVDQDREFEPNIYNYKGKELIAQSTDAAQTSGYEIMSSLIKEGATKIVLLFPPHGNSVVESGFLGVEQAVKQHPGVSIVAQEWTTQTYNNAVSTMQELLLKYKPGQINGVFGIGGTMAQGALYAINQAHRTSQFHVATWDDFGAIIKAIQNGTMVETQGGAWLEGGFMLIALYDYLHGHAPLNRQPLFTQIDVTKSNAAAYNSEFLQTGDPLTAAQIRALSLTYNPKANLPKFIENFHSTWQQPNRGVPNS
jgi:ABC-type sugar transport system substrate-binding protein